MLQVEIEETFYKLIIWFSTEHSCNFYPVQYVSNRLPRHIMENFIVVIRFFSHIIIFSEID